MWVEPRLLAAQPGHWLGASDQAGLLGPTQPMLGGLDLAQKKKRKKRKESRLDWALGSAGPNYVY